MKLNTDSKQRIKSIFLFMIEFYKIIIGCYLIVFVPNNCGGLNCILQDDIHNHIGITTNTISFLSFILLYYIEIFRENWCIKNLDIDYNIQNNNLDNEIENYPKIKKELFEINSKYINYTKICIALQFINIITSTIIISQRWNGMSTLTPFMSYILIIILKLYNSCIISITSIKNELVYSSYLVKNEIYNIIDKDIYTEKSTENNHNTI